jgi:glycosyltransferase involved in cell wall biosynthesis
MPETGSATAPAPTLSFIVPAHDEAPLIGACLRAIEAAAGGHPHEIVVVDDASTDATADIARALGAQVLPVAHRQIAATRNAGAGAARGEVLLFVDADTRVTRDVVDAAMAALARGALGGGCAVRFDEARWHERAFTALVMRAFRLTGIAPGCFLFCTRAAFEAAGGFDERLYAAEDVALSRALARVGRFAILREQVTTSDRKLRTFGLPAHLGLALRLLLRGRRVLESREHLGLWYDARRHKPAPRE